MHSLGSQCVYISEILKPDHVNDLAEILKPDQANDLT